MPNYLLLAGSNLYEYVSEAGLLALFTIMAVEESGIPLPVPADMILFFSGYLVSTAHFAFWPSFFTSIAGVIIGSSILFWAFRVGGRPFAHKYGKFILLPPERLDKLDDWFHRKGKWAVLIGRFVPGLRVFVSAIAGLSDLPYFYFLPQIIIASSIWAAMFMLLGRYLGNNWQWGAQTIVNHSYVFFIVFFGTLTLYLWRHRTKKSLSNQKK